jgi:alpha-beta hydrolase superfamily lysophospholipase
MGSLMTQQVMISYGAELDAVALSGSNGAVGPLLTFGLLAARAERRRLGPRGRSRLLNALSFGAFNRPFRPNRTDFDWLSRDPHEVDLYIEDPLCGFMVTTQFWVDMLRGLQRIEDPAAQARIPKALPIYLLAGALDPVSDAAKGLHKLLAAYRAAGLSNLSHRFYPGARHELLNETNRDEVTADLLAWLDRALQP